jgi:hypothetical protein
MLHTLPACLLQLDKYQEQPHLLDPVLPSILAPLLSSVRSTLREWYAKSEAENAALQAALISRGNSTVSAIMEARLQKLAQGDSLLVAAGLRY